MSDLAVGRYRHYKGGEYTVMGVAQHSETGEALVVYRPEYGERGLWVRPLSMFLENVETRDGVVPRFALINAGKTIRAESSTSGSSPNTNKTPFK